MSKNKYPVVERFYSVQGEGYNTGRAAYFIRLAGCDICCPWCDSKESWKRSGHEEISISDIVDEIGQIGAGNVVITGGEPTLHELTPLTSELKKNGADIWLETAGTNKITGHIDWVCLSPKRNKLPIEENYKKADELKIVIENRDDFLWAEELSHKVSENCVLYLQPQWERFDDSIMIITNYVRNNPKWRVSLQTHKFMNVL